MSTERPTDVARRDASAEVTTSDAPERFENPGLPPHRHRKADVDEASAKRVQRQLLVLFGLSALGTITFLVAYFVVRPGESVASVRTSNMVLGVSLFVTLFALGAGIVQWVKAVMSDREYVEQRHPQRSDEAVRAEAVEALRQGAEDSGIGRRNVLKGAVVGAAALAPLTIAVPLVGEVGSQWDTRVFSHTLWRRGTRLTRDPSGEPIRAQDVTIGSAYHVIPEGLYDAEHWIEEKAKAIVLMVRMDPAELKESPERQGWSYDGIVAYSKVCTHVGCPVALYEQQTHHLLCPCHQSTFDMSDGAKVVFGPASRPLPQLPITVDDEGYLIAQSDFHEPVGPSYWERLKHQANNEETAG